MSKRGRIAQALIGGLVLFSIVACSQKEPQSIPVPKGPEIGVVNCTTYPSHYIFDFTSIGEDKLQIFSISSDELVMTFKAHQLDDALNVACAFEAERVRAQH